MSNGHERRQHERIPIVMQTRLWLDESTHGKHIQFEGFANTRDLAIGGTFIQSNYLLPVGATINLEMTIEDTSEILAARGEVVHRLDSPESGMGIMFTHVDAENRERLLRFFVSDRIQDFYKNRFLMEFPQLSDSFSLKDVALVVNLWEDKEGRLTALHGAGGTPQRTQREQREQRERKREQIKATKAKGRGRSR